MEASIDLVSDNDDEYGTEMTLVGYASTDGITNKKRKNLFFTKPEESIAFIDVFKKYRVLYGKRSEQSKSARDRAWSCISNELNVPVNALKARWRCIKDTHTKVKRKKASDSWYMMEYLGFLDDDTKIDDEMESEDNNNGFDESTTYDHDLDSIKNGKHSKRSKLVIKAVTTLLPDHQQFTEIENEIRKSNNKKITKPPPLRLIKSPSKEYVESAYVENENSNSIVEEEIDPLESSTCLDNSKLDYYVSLSEEEAAYGYHISTQLKQFPKIQREILRHKINTLIYQSFMNLNN